MEPNALSPHASSTFADSDASLAPLADGFIDVLKLNDAAHLLAYNLALSPILQRLAPLSSNQIWTNQNATEDDFSLSPLPYITKIGELLITLPQYLEPFVSSVRLSSGLLCLPWLW